MRAQGSGSSDTTALQGRGVLRPIPDGALGGAGRSVAGMDTPSLTAAVRAELLAHPEVSEGTHRFGGIVFRLGRRELGHLHGETLADLPFPRRVRGPEDVAAVVELFRMAYERAAAQSERGAAA